MTKKLGITLAAVLLLGTVVYGASAFSSAQLDRQANINVVADDQGIISLTPGSTPAASLNSNGELAIDAPASGNGLNVEGQFVYGSNSTPSSNHLFAVENTSSTEYSLTTGYTVTGDAQGASDAVTFKVYDGSGTEVATFSNGGTATFTLSPATPHYVVMEVDTTGLDSNADLSGTVSITS